MVKNINEQFFLKKQFISVLKKKLRKYKYKNVLEIGIGTGLFTRAFFRDNVKVVAYEIDRSLKFQTFRNKRVKVIYQPFDFELLRKKDVVLISAPPYSLLEEISTYKVKYILMVGERYLKYFSDYRVICVLKGSSFSPKSRGEHFIITNL